MDRWFRFLKRLFISDIRAPHLEEGLRAEKIAKNYLKKQGLRFEMARFRSRQGEIDLIMWDRAMLVFVEVRFRANSHFEKPYQTITYTKQQRLIQTARYYLLKTHLRQQIESRFDVVSMSGDLKKPNIEWIRNAF